MRLEATTHAKTKILPISKPMIYGFNYYAFPLSILGGYEQAQSWIHSNFIQLELYYNFADGHVVPIAPSLFSYANNPNPWLSEQRIERDLMATFGIKINDMLIDSINKGHYAYLTVDEYYIPDRGSYGERHFVHDILVYGYDMESEMFEVLGFRENGLFGPSQVSFAEFEQAYLSLDEIDNWCSYVRLLKFNEKGRHYFNVKLAADLIEDYLLSRNTHERYYTAIDPYEHDLVYGLDIYEHLKRYFRLLVEEKIWLDIKYLHMLWEHKKCMAARVHYMEEQGHLDKQLGFSKRVGEIEQRVQVLRNIMLRYSMDFKPERLEKIIDGLDALARDEAAVLGQLVQAMRASLKK